MKKLFALFLALCLLLSAVPAAFADAWIPQDDEKNQSLCDLPEKEDDCYVLNAFLTRYAETGATELSEYFSTEADYYKSLLKHFELNPELYPGSVLSYTDEDGNTYMEIDASCFEEVMAELYNTKMPVENCPGYADGKIRVTAGNYGAEKRVFASATHCDIMGHSLYYVSFETYMTESDVEELLSVPNSALDKDSLTLLAEGSCLFYFYGDVEQSSFTADDFTFLENSLYEVYAELPYSGENLPAAPDILPDAEDYIEVSTSDGSTSSDSQAVDGIGSDTLTGNYETIPETKPEEDKAAKPFPISPTLWIALGVVVLALAAFVLILLVFKKKQS